MDMRKKRAAKEADEILKKLADDVAKAYGEEAERLMQQAQAEGEPDLKFNLKKPQRKSKLLHNRMLRIAAMFIIVVFVGSIVIPIPKADAWRVWWLDFIIGENSEDVDINNDDDFKYYVSELPEGFTLEKEYEKHNQLLAIYTNNNGESISFSQINGGIAKNHADNEYTDYSKEMIGDFEVLVGYDNSKTEFEFNGKNTIMTVNTNATYEVGKFFIENIKEFE